MSSLAGRLLLLCVCVCVCVCVGKWIVCGGGSGLYVWEWIVCGSGLCVGVDCVCGDCVWEWIVCVE